jgi:hypothetical protein
LSRADDVFDAGSDPAVCPVVVVVDDPAGVVAAGWGHGGDAAVAAITTDLAFGAEQVHRGAAGHDDVVAVTGPAAPATMTRRR